MKKRKTYKSHPRSAADRLAQFARSMAKMQVQGYTNPMDIKKDYYEGKKVEKEKQKNSKLSRRAYRASTDAMASWRRASGSGFSK